MSKVGVIDYGAGNIKSVTNVLKALNVNAIVSGDIKDLEGCEKLIFPGQGRAGPAMKKLKNSGLDEFIKKWEKPFLGICLGMQLLVDYSEEDDTECLGIIGGAVKRFKDTSLSVPQIGWNNITQIKSSKVLDEVVNKGYFYFVNSYYVDSTISNTVATTCYGNNFASVIEKDNYIGIQFHPEKSGKLGKQIIRNFILGKDSGNQQSEGLTKRVIACMDVKDGIVVKGEGYKSLKESGDPVELAKKYSDAGVDELIFLDIGATVESRGTLLELVTQVSEQVNIPLCVGGGIKTKEDVRRALLTGADKVSFGSIAVKNPSVIKESVEEFGSQCIVVSIDPKRENGKWIQYINGGKTSTKLDAVEHAVEMASLGVGELLVNSLDRDGTSQGYDIDLLKAIKTKVSVPVIASSGAGKLSHFSDVIEETNVDAVLAAGLFHSDKLSVSEVKNYLKSKNIKVR